MAVEETRRIALHRAAAGTWGEEAADTLVELVTPAGEVQATRADIRGVLTAIETMDQRWDDRIVALEARSDLRLSAMDERWDARLAAMDERWDARLAAMDERLAATDERWEARSEAMEHRLTASFERGLREAITTQTRVIVVSLLVALVAIAGLAIGTS